MTITAGSDTYGRVKTVAGTPIVTQFFMLQALPLFPLKSFYLLKLGATQSQGIPFIASSSTTQIHGVPLAKVDRASAIMAYLRAVLSVLVLVGSIGVIFGGVMAATGERLKDDQKMILMVAAALLLTGAALGGLTYLLPLCSSRERAIRGYCAELLGMAVDPARVTAEASEMLASHAPRSHGERAVSRDEMVRELINVRATLARSRHFIQLESRTDDLLEKLRQADLLAQQA